MRQAQNRNGHPQKRPLDFTWAQSNDLFSQREKKKTVSENLEAPWYGNHSAQRHIKHRCITIWYHHSIVLQGKWTLLLIELLLTFFHFTFHHISCDMGGWRSALWVFFQSSLMIRMFSHCSQPLCLWKFAVLCRCHSTGTLLCNHTMTMCVCVCVCVCAFTVSSGKENLEIKHY